MDWNPLHWAPFGRSSDNADVRSARAENRDLRNELAEAINRPIADPLAVPGWFEGRGGPFVEARGAVGARLAPWITQNAVYAPHSYRGMVRQGYFDNELIRGGLDLVVRTFAQANAQVVDADEQRIVGHALPKLCQNPSPNDYEYALWEWTLLDLYLKGNAFWEYVRAKSGRVVNIWRLEPERVGIFPDPTTGISHYLYEVGGEWYKIPRRNVLHWKFHNPGADPLDAYFGISPLLAAWRSLMTDSEMTNFTKVTLSNLAVPALVVEAQQKVDDGFVRRFQQSWRERYGKANRGTPAVLQQGMTVKQVGFDMEQLAFADLREIIETRLVMTIGGAPLLYMLGTYAGMQRSIYNNYSEARDALTEDVVGPLWSRFATILSKFLLPEWDRTGTQRVSFNLDRVISVEERRLKRIAQATASATAGVITRDEARALAGYPALGRGGIDELYLAINQSRIQVNADGTVDPLPEVEEDETDAGSDFGTPPAAGGGAKGSDAPDAAAAAADEQDNQEKES